MTTVLLTGAAGMIGATVLGELESAGATVWTTDLRPLDREQHIVADLEDPVASAALATMGHDVVLHLAGATGGDIGVLVRSNVLSTTNLLGALPAGTRVIVAGSAAEYGSSNADRISEDAPLQPVSRYGWTKVCQTEVASAVAQQRGLALAVARPFNIVGPSLPESTAFGNIRAQIVATQPGETAVLTTGRLDITRDLVPIGFVAEVLAAMATGPAIAGAYNICTGQGLVLSDVVERMANHRGVDLDLSVDPALAALPAAERNVGNPDKVTTTYGLATAPTASDIAETILGGAIRDQSEKLPSRRPTPQASQDQ